MRRVWRVLIGVAAGVVLISAGAAARFAIDDEPDRPTPSTGATARPNTVLWNGREVQVCSWSDYDQFVTVGGNLVWDDAGSCYRFEE